MFRDKGLIIGIVVTTLLIIGGVFFFTKPKTESKPTPVSSEILAPENSLKTSGVLNGEFQPATPSAQVTLVEFGDYQCPACGQYNPFVYKLMQEAQGKVNFVVRHFPLSQHKNAIPAAKAAEAAALQNKFWPMHEKLYGAQTEWVNLSDPTEKFVAYAQEMGLDLNKFKSDMSLPAIQDKINRDMNDGNLIRLSETPTFYVNGVKLQIPPTYEAFKAAVLAEVK